MAAYKASFVINSLRKNELSDPNAVTWNDSELLDVMNEAILMLMQFRPDANSVTEVVELAVGAVQQIPADGLQFLRMFNNVNSDDTIGQAVRYVDIIALNNADPNWQSVPTGGIVHEYGFLNDNLKRYYVNPSATLGMRVQIEYSKIPNPVDDVTDDFPLQSTYIPAVKNLMLHILLSGDNNSGVNTGKNHLEVAMSMLQIKTIADKNKSRSTNRKEQ